MLETISDEDEDCNDATQLMEHDSVILSLEDNTSPAPNNTLDSHKVPETKRNLAAYKEEEQERTET